MNQIGVGIIGCGGMGTDLARGIGELETARLAGVYDPDETARAAVAQKHGGQAFSSREELLGAGGIDAVIVAAPQFAHAEATIAAARAGKHVFCEKPMAVTLEDCDAMIQACAEAGVKLMIGQVCRYIGIHATAHDLAASGEYGKPVCITMHRLGGPWGGIYDTGWRMKAATSGGTLMEINAHEIDFMRWVCGDVEAVYAAGGQYVDERLDYPDLTLVTLHFRSGAKGLLHAGQVSVAGAYGGRIDLEKGSIVCPAFWGEGAGVAVSKSGAEPEFLPAEDIEVENPVNHELRDFIGCILNGTPPPVPGPEGRAAVEIAIAAYRSVQTGQVVSLPL